MNIHLASPHFLLLLPLALLPLWRARRPATLTFSQLALVQTARRSWRLRLRPWLPPLQAAGLALLLLALARPQTRQPQAPLPQAETAVVFALDVSNSMTARDLIPDRLTAAKGMIAEMLTAQPQTAFGLVLFAGRAVVAAPPTRDHAVLRQVLAQADFAGRMGMPDGTALGAGIAAAAGLLVDAPADRRFVVLLTDGVSTDAALDPARAAQAAAQLNIPIYTVGLGQSGLVPFPQQGPQGEYLVYWESPLDEAGLQAIAADTDAAYARTVDALTLRQTTAVLLTETAASTPPPGWHMRDWYAPLLGIGLALLLLAHAAQHTALRTLPEA